MKNTQLHSINKAILKIISLLEAKRRKKEGLNDL